MKSEQKIKAVRGQIIKDNIRKGASREIYSEIYQPITEGIKSQEEKLSSHLKALPRIKEQLALLGDEMKGIKDSGSPQTYQGLPQLFKEPLQPLPLIEDMSEEDINKILEEEYGKETEK